MVAQNAAQQATFFPVSDLPRAWWQCFAVPPRRTWRPALCATGNADNRNDPLAAPS